MCKRALLIAALVSAGPFAAKAAAMPPDLPHAALLIIAPDSGQDFGPLRTVEQPTLDARQIHYAARASGLDRIDPADFKVLGAEIGGNGVQGGAVVSLSWPTER